MILKEVLLTFFSQLEKHKIKYAVIGNYSNLPEYTNNDVDLWVSSVKNAEKILYDIAHRNQLSLYLRNKTANGSNNYFYNKESPSDLIKIDLMHETALHSTFCIVNAKQIENNLEIYNGFPVVNQPLETVMHLLYPLLTFGIIKEKYKSKIIAESKSPAFRTLLFEILGVKMSQDILHKIESEDWLDIITLKKRIKGKVFLNFCFDLIKPKRIKIVFLHIFLAIKRLFNQNNGTIVSFTGLDGAGKTTIKDQLVTISDKYFLKGKTKEFYWRPFLFPRLAKFVGKEDQIHENFSETGRRVVSYSIKSKVFSCLKFTYYTLDFIVGKLKYLKQLKTGGLIIFDRYYFDNIIYPERFGFSLSKKTMRLVDKYLIPQPDIIFYFTADSLELYNRKKELSIEEINFQKELYSNEIKIKNNIIVVDNTNSDIQETQNEVLSAILLTMSKRYKING